MRGNDQENRSSYGGNFGNSMEGSYRDQDRDENMYSGAGRGEFGAQGRGNTQGGYGNQDRDYDTRSRGDDTTTFSAAAGFVAMRIDWMLLQPGAELAVDCPTGSYRVLDNEGSSDHEPVQTEFKIGG